MLHIQDFCFNPVQENTYVIYDDEGNAAIVDCGCMTGSEQEELQNYIERNRLTPRLLLCTHMHFDHVWGNGWVLRTWPEVKAYAHPIDLEQLPSPSEQIRKFGLQLRYEEVNPSVYIHLAEGDRIPLGEHALEVRHVPGHSPGHVVFYAADGGFVVAGDTLFAENIGRTDFWYGSYDDLVENIRTKLFSLPPETVVYPGHEGTTTIGHEIAYNPYVK